MIGLDALINPISIRYRIRTNWGVTSNEITLEIPLLLGNDDATNRFVGKLWDTIITPVITRSVSLELVEIAHYASLGAITIALPSVTPALFGGTPARREESAVMVMHTGHTDKYARRRWFFPGMPRVFQNETLLTANGEAALMRIAFAMMMGMQQFDIGGSIQWLIAYPGVLPPSIPNTLGVAFRKVQSVRICRYCDAPPDRVPLDWP